MGKRRYRSKLELFRDFLRAVQQDPKKTRILGLANLNPRSFERYARHCLEQELVVRTPVGYQLTARAEAVLGRLDRLLAMRTEVTLALSTLERLVGPNAGAPSGTTEPPRYVSPIIWAGELLDADLTRSLARPVSSPSPAGPVAPARGPRFWWEREPDPSELPAAALGDLLAGGTSTTSAEVRRPPRPRVRR